MQNHRRLKILRNIVSQITIRKGFKYVPTAADPAGCKESVLNSLTESTVPVFTENCLI